MKAKLIFNLEDEEDSISFSRCTKSLDMTLALLEISNYLRSKIKNTEDETEDKILESVKEKFYEILADRSIDLDNLIR